MEKIGLFDLIDKFASERNGKTFMPADKTPPKKNAGTDGLRDPDFGAQPQYAMNAKMQAFMARHENLKSEIPLKNKKRAERKPRADKKPPQNK